MDGWIDAFGFCGDADSASAQAAIIAIAREDNWSMCAWNARHAQATFGDGAIILLLYSYQRQLVTISTHSSERPDAATVLLQSRTSQVATKLSGKKYAYL